MDWLKEGLEYDDQALDKLERSLSSERLAPYLALAEGDRAYAIALYEWNTRISESLFGILQGFEVTLRNAMHETMSGYFQRQDWYDAANFRPSETELIESAKQRIVANGHTVSPGRMVAELTLGFWTALTGKAYAQPLWDQFLHKTFRDTPLGRKQAAKRLQKIRYLRNRVAHHESIIGKTGRERDLTKDVGEIMEATAWICRTTAQWIVWTNSFDAQYRSRPLRPQQRLPIDSS